MSDVPTFSFKNAKAMSIPVKMIRENTDALRTEVDKTSEKYLQLVDSVKAHGVMNPISVREITDPTTGQTMYGLVDGLHRWNAAMDVGLDTINAQVGDIQEGNLLEAQIIANVHKIETKPVQYTKALIAILGSNPLLTKAELASRLSHNVQWLDDRLGLDNLKDNIKVLVDEGSLNLTNAYSLSKLPPERQEEFLQAALTKPGVEFSNIAATAKKEHDKAIREGRKAEGYKFQPNPRMRRFAVVNDQLALAEKDPSQCSVVQAAQAQNCTGVADTVAFVLKWLMHMDPATLQAEEKAWNDERAQAKEAAEKRKIEREAKKQKEAEAKLQTATA